MSKSSIDAYYHATMQGVEQKISFRSRQIKKYAPITYKTKKSILSKNNEKLSSIFNVDYILTYPHPRSFKSDNEFHTYMSSFPFHKCLNQDISLNEYIPCLFFENQQAWFHADKNGHIRYYTKTVGGLPISLDLVDFIEIIFEVNPFEAKSLFLKWIKSSVKDTFYENALRTRYQENHVDFELMMCENLATKKLLEPLKAVYQEMLEIGASPNYLTFNAYEFELFFVSTRYLAARVGTIHYTNVSRILNTLNALGFIEKVETDSLSPNTKKMIDSWTKSMGYNRPVGFFKIPSIDQNRASIEIRIETFMKNNGSYRSATSFSREDIEASLSGLEVSHMNKNIEETFNYLLNTYNYVRKSDIFKMGEGLWSKKEIDEHWNKLIEITGTVYVKPNKAMKTHYELNSLEYLAIRRKS